MAIKTRDEIVEMMRARIGEEPDDESISFLEDVTDTFTDLENRANSEDWKQKYEENDKNWRKKYTERFFEGNPNTYNVINGANETNEYNEPNEPEKPKTFDDLFN